MDFSKRLTYFIAVFFLLISTASCYLEYNGWINIELHHAIDHTNPNSFSYRGNVTIQSLNSGISKTVQNALTTAELNSLKILAERDDYYRVRATVTYGSNAKYTFLTSIKACSIFLAQLNDVIWVSIDANGFVTAVTQTTTSTWPDKCENIESDLKDFNTDVILRHTELAPVPDTAGFIQKMDREREARERGETRDNRSLLAKYWMYIVPLVLLILISGATNQDGAK